MAAQTVDDILAQSKFPTIVTTTVPDGEGGYFLHAKCEFLKPRKVIRVEWDDRLHIDGNHAAAALAMLAALGAEDRQLVMGSHTDDSYVFIQLPAGVVTL